MANQNILNFLGQFGGGQSQPLQSPAGFVQQQPPVNLPPYITPTTPTPKGGSPFGNMSEKLDSKSQGLALMLYALGGALKGDKDFVQNTLALQQMQEGKKKQEEQKKIYQDFLKGMEGKYDQRMIDFAKILPPEQGTQLVMKTFDQKPMTEKQKYDELAAQIKQEIALRGRGSAAFDEQQGGNPNLLEFYDTYIVGGNIDPFKAALAGLFGQNNGATPPPSQKSYKVIGASYSGQSADKVIQNAMTVNPGMSKEKVIQNLIAQGIISEG